VPLKTRADYENLLSNPREITRIGRNDYWYPSCVYENPLHDYSATLRLACAAGGLAYRRYADPDRPVKGRFFNEDSSAFKIQMAVFRAFSDAVRQNGAAPLIVMLPDLKAVARLARREPPIYKPVMDHLRNSDVPFLDAAEQSSNRNGNIVRTRWPLLCSRKPADRHLVGQQAANVRHSAVSGHKCRRYA
jgi:hypothetical protein